MIEKLDIVVIWMAKATGFSALSVKWMGVILLLGVLLMALRKPWKMVQITIVLALFGSLVYVAYDLAKIGSNNQKKLMEHPMEEIKNINE